MRFVLSTVGTSILTNLIDNENSDEAIWRSTLRDSANLKSEELKDGAQEVIDTLAERALGKLMENNVKANRRLSAELNGIYGIYGNGLPGIPSERGSDQHYLICTDTAQGQKTGTLIRDFLKEQGFNVDTYTPSRLSTRDPEAFTTGAKDLIRWLEDTVPGWRNNGYRVIFNLVGGFKSLQGYMNTFGAFYADEVIYIFEAPTADLIRIPRLPIRIDPTVIQDHRTEFALMAAGKLYPGAELAGMQETLLECVDADGGTYAGLSAWGELLWNGAKWELLTEDLLQLPRLKYEPTFNTDFGSQEDPRARLKLQETLVRVAYELEQSRGNLAPLKQDGGLRFEQFKGRKGIYKFRIDRAIRVTCRVSGHGLVLRRYGHKEDVYGNP